MRFDAYNATVREAEFPLVISVLESGLQGHSKEAKARGRLEQVVNIDVDNRTACSVGVDRASRCVFVEGKGHTSPRLAKLLRVHFPGHGVARADVCEDFSEPKAFERLQSIIRRVKEPRVHAAYVMLSDDPTDGRTWQCGKPSGVVLSRLYEKGKQPGFIGVVDPDLVRLEFQVRPQYSAGKLAAAAMEPPELIGFARWATVVAKAVLELDIPRVESEVRVHSLDKTATYIGRAFRRTLEELHADGVDVMREWQDLWAEDDRLKSLHATRGSAR